MSYKIQYTPQDDARYPQKMKAYRIKWSRGIFGCLLITVAIWLTTHGFPEALMTPEMEITKHAAKVMVETVRRGEPIEEAVLVFCKQVIQADA